MNIPKKVIAMHDICGYGRSSMTTIIPILAALGIQVCPAPTAILTQHFGFKKQPFIVQLDKYLEEALQHWKENNFQFSAFYSGYFFSLEQFDIATQFLEDFTFNFIYIDPVLGDREKLYPGISLEHVEYMKKLVSYADIISPNTTEAAFLVNRTPKEFLLIEEAKEILDELSYFGAKYIIITGNLDIAKNTVSSLIKDVKEKKYYEVSMPSISAHFEGTGDAFASVILGNLLNEETLLDSVNQATTYIYKSLKIALKYNSEICVEAGLPILMSGKKVAKVREI